MILEGAQTPDVKVQDIISKTDWQDKGFGSTDMTPELCEIYEVTLGHAASTRIDPQEE